MFGEKCGADADAQIADRTRQPLDGIPQTLAAISGFPSPAPPHGTAPTSLPSKPPTEPRK